MAATYTKLTGAQYQPGSGSEADQALATKYSQITPEAPSIDPRYQALQTSQAKGIKTYKDNMAGQADTVMRGYADDSRRALAEKVHDIGAGYNQRGLLYSGLKAGSQSDAASAAAQALAQKRADVNQTQQGNLDTLYGNATNTGFGMAGLGSDSYVADANNQSQAVAQALKEMQWRRSGLNSIGQGVGGALGYIAGASNGGGSTSPVGGAASGAYAGLMGSGGY